jgi:adenine-specific DNA-methyltransferase
LNEAKQGMTTPSIWFDVALNQHASQELNIIFGEKAKFETPKPTELIKLIVHIASGVNDIVLDSFAGSGTTAHSVLKINKEEQSNRKFILIETEPYAESITAERVKRAINGYGQERNYEEGTGGGFVYYTIGMPLFDEQMNLNNEVPTEEIRKYVYFTETQMALKSGQLHQLGDNAYLLDKVNETAYYLYYRKDTITEVNVDFLATIRSKADQYVVYADNCLLSKEFMLRKNIIFKKIPRDITRF